MSPVLREPRAPLTPEEVAENRAEKARRKEARDREAWAHRTAGSRHLRSRRRIARLRRLARELDRIESRLGIVMR